MKIPNFKTETEEAKWWAAHPELILEKFQKAEKEGKLGRGTAVKKAQVSK
jgi:hypothetical protein